MNGYTSSIDTDAGIGTILSHFSTDYITHVIEDSLNMKFRPFNGDPMPNYVDVLERQFQSIYQNSPDFANKVSDVRIETYQEIILIICKYYNLTFEGNFESMAPQEILGVAHTLYDIFISRFTEYMINFFVSYIVANSDSINSYLKSIDDETINKPKESGLYSPRNFIDSKFILIHANINRVIYNMAGYDISLQELLNYFLDTVTAQRIGNLVSDNNNIYKNYYASYIVNEQYSAGVLTAIKLTLQSRTQEILNIRDY
jgi:hypothetical protein